MLPKKALNIYNKNDENVNSIIEFYFKELELDLEESMNYLLDEKQRLELNQVEFICRKIKEAYFYIFTLNLNGKISLKNLLSYAVMALTVNEPNWQGSQTRLKIAKEFYDFVKKTEIDIEFLERNN